MPQKKKAVHSSSALKRQHLSASRPRRQAGQATRRKLLDIARSRFAKYGYDGTSVQGILDDAGVTVPVLYHHFGNKLGLFVAVAEEVYDIVVDDMQTHLESNDLFHDSLNTILEAAASIHRKDPSLAYMTFTVQLEATRNKDLSNALRPVQRSFLSLVDRIASKSPEVISGRIDQIHMYRALIAILNGLNSIAIVAQRDDEFESTITALQSFFSAK